MLKNHVPNSSLLVCVAYCSEDAEQSAFFISQMKVITVYAEDMHYCFRVLYVRVGNGFALASTWPSEPRRFS